jgi:DNA-binding Xre family transcriptional regulator
MGTSRKYGGNPIDESAWGDDVWAVTKSVGNPVDVYVGSRVRTRRISLEMRQEQLAEALGLTIEQVRRFEDGSVRIGASMLCEISRHLECPPKHFFEAMGMRTLQ